ncbi:cytochrome b/b6 domain-containing protein [Glycomyces tenuis]|nr:cytochrome b/b6 domain-containing protein [Glycomyces tenuis]
MATEPGRTVERNSARARWFHAAVYLTVLVLMGTGWWLTLGQEGRPSPLAAVTGLPDAEIHTAVGWALTAIAVAGPALGLRGAKALLVDSARFRRSDLHWAAGWPKAVFTGRFARHEGRFDPGQRIANLVMVALLLALIVSGIGLWAVSGGPAFVWFNRIHRWATYAITPVILGHILIAAGVLPGYRGVWRAMHLGGRLRRGDAARVWPGWLERTTRGR